MADAAAAAGGEVDDGYAVTAHSLFACGVRLMFGVVGIPVTPLATAAQAAGIRFIGLRNEQAAGMAAAAAGYLTRTPAVLLTVSGPGMVNGLAGLAHASVNAWPLLLLSGSTDRADVGKGGFQELDQVLLARPVAKSATKAASVLDIPAVLAKALATAAAGRPGGVYVDLPSDVLLAMAPALRVRQAIQAAAAAGGSGGDAPARPPGPAASEAAVMRAAALLASCQRPLLIVGKGAAYARAEGPLAALLATAPFPFVATPMGRGVVPDAHPLCANAARAAALSGAQVVLVVGARLNWMLHFGEPPRWAPNTRFILVDILPGPREATSATPAGTLRLTGDAAVVLTQLRPALAAALAAVAAAAVAAAASGAGPSPADQAAAAAAAAAHGAPALPGPPQWAEWTARLAARARANTAALERRLQAPPPCPLDYHAALRVIRDEIARYVGGGSSDAGPASDAPPGAGGGRGGGHVPEPLIVSEGANTMDMARTVLQHQLDAATWGTMGVGLGYAAAAAAVDPTRLVIAVEGDSALGFSGMELETLVRFKMRVIVLVFNNGGIYGGDRRPAGTAAQGRWVADPAPTEFVPAARHDKLMEAFGGLGMRAETAAELHACLRRAMAHVYLGPALIDIVIDPKAGVESGRAHDFNLPKASL